MSEDLKIVTVAPITKTILNEDLTYFTTKDIKVGALVSITVRNKEVLGVITSLSAPDGMKSDLKTSEFGFKKIKKVWANDVYLPDFLTASRKTADFFAVSTGQILNLMTPKIILAEWQKGLIHDNKITHEIPIDTTNRRFEIAVLGLPDEERYSFYRSLIREEFAKKHSVFFVLPTIHDAEECAELLKKGIEEYTVVMHGRLSAKNMSERWAFALSEKHPILMVTTPSFMSIPRDDVATIIIDKENSQFYKTMTRPFIDIRTFAETFAKTIRSRLVLGDSIPRIEDIYNAEAGNFIQESPLRYRFPKDIYQEIIDMRKEGSILGPKVKLAIKESIQKKQHALVVCARKGLGTTTVCADCGEIITCKNCSSPGAVGLPMVIYRIKSTSGGENVFFCNKCGKKSPTDVVCANCSSWKLKVLGVATEGVEVELRSLHPEAKIFRIDGTAAKNYKQARTIINEFINTPGAVLVATEMVLGYLNHDVETVAVISIDTLFSIPDFRANENIFNFLTRLRLKTTKRFLIQTRRPEEKVFNYVLNGDLLEFYRDEIKGRKRFNYPPFKILIKIIGEGPEKTTNQEMNQLEGFLQKYDPSRFNAFVERINNRERVNILLRVDPRNWPPQGTDIQTKKDVSSELPYSNLLEILRSLPERFMIKVDPDNIL